MLYFLRLRQMTICSCRSCQLFVSFSYEWVTLLLAEHFREKILESQFPKTWGDILKSLILSNQQFIPKIFNAFKKNKGSESILTCKTLQTRKVVAEHFFLSRYCSSAAETWWIPRDLNWVHAKLSITRGFVRACVCVCVCVMDYYWKIRWWWRVVGFDTHFRTGLFKRSRRSRGIGEWLSVVCTCRGDDPHFIGSAWKREAPYAEMFGYKKTSDRLLVLRFLKDLFGECVVWNS